MREPHRPLAVRECQRAAAEVTLEGGVAQVEAPSIEFDDEMSIGVPEVDPTGLVL